MNHVVNVSLAVVISAGLAVSCGQIKETVVKQATEKKLAEAGLTPEVLKKMGDEGLQNDPMVLAKIAKGGQPEGRWKEGLMFDGMARCRG